MSGDPFFCGEVVKGAHDELTADLSAVAKKHGIEFVVCVTQGETKKLMQDGREVEIRAKFIDAKEYNTDTVHAASSMVGAGMYLYKAGLAMAEFEGRRIRDERRALGPTHRCKVCGTLWRKNPPAPPVFPTESWTSMTDERGACCDNVEMGDQIEPLP